MNTTKPKKPMMKKYYAISGVSESKHVVDIFENTSEDDAEVVIGYYFCSQAIAEQFKTKFNSLSFKTENEIDDFYKNYES